MFFLGLAGNEKQASIESAVLAIYGENDAALVVRRVMNAPAEIAEPLTALQSEQTAALDVLGRLHVAIGQWIGAAALATLVEAKVAPQAVELSGCKAFQVTGGLTLGDLAIAAQHSGLTISALSAGEDAETCARAAWKLWQKKRQAASAAPNTQVLTEDRNPATLEIDLLPTIEIVRLINREDSSVARAVGSQLSQIAEAVDRITERMQRGGRMIYAGAGTSGRIGMLDASEIPPTYGTGPEVVVGIIAGGETAIQRSLEGVEDDVAAAAQAIADLQVNENDSLIAIAASGKTPYALGAMQEARKRGALIIALACNSPSPMEELADVAIAPLVGPEAISGSTRMKAGTAQKMALNMISTAVMVRLGKTFSNLMVNMQTTNKKLHRRARNIVAQACGISEEEAGKALVSSGGEMKTAIVSIIAGIPAGEARIRLAQNGGVVRRAITATVGTQP